MDKDRLKEELSIIDGREPCPHCGEKGSLNPTENSWQCPACGVIWANKLPPLPPPAGTKETT